VNQKYIVLISGAAIVIAVAGMLITYQLFSSQQPIPSQEITTQPKTSSISDILPTRDDVGTTWKIFPTAMSPFDIMAPPEINKNAFVSTAHLTKLKSEIENSQGYQEGIAQIFWRNLDGQDFVISVWIFKFDLPDNAWFQYNDTITRVYEEGGFVEYPVKQSGMPCYGTITSKLKGESYDRMNLYCVKDDIFYQIYAANAPHLSDNDKVTVVDFGKTISNKILPRLSVTTDKISYSNTDTIVISGMVKEPMELPLTMRISDPNNILVQVLQVDLAQDSLYSVTIKPDGVMWKTKGTYTVEVKYGQDARAETTFLFNPPVPEPPPSPVPESSKVVRFQNSIGGGGVTQNRVFKELPSTLPTDSWVAEFDYKYTYSSIPSHLPLVLTTTWDDPQLQPLTPSLAVLHGIDLNQLAIYSVSGYSTGIPILLNTQYYVTLERAPTQLKLSVFSDPARTFQVSGSPVSSEIATTDYNNLNFIQHSTTLVSGSARILTAEIDNTVITHSKTDGTKIIIFEDDYSSDTGWTQVGSSVTVNKPYSPSPEPPRYISPYLEITASIRHDIVGGKVKSITTDMESKSVLISIEATYDGVLVVTLPRTVADAVVGDEDDSFFVIIDGAEVDYEEVSKTSTDRTLSIPFKKGAQEIEIIGAPQLS